MILKGFGKILAVVALGGGIFAATLSPSLACGGRSFKSAASQKSLPGWVGAIALTAVLGGVAGNEAMKRASTDKPIG